MNQQIDWHARAEAERQKKRAKLAPIREGSFVLVVNARDCKWAIYQSKRNPDYHEMDKEVVFTDEPYDLPDDIAPIRPYYCHDKVLSGRYDYDIEAINLWSVRAVYQTEAEFRHVAEQLRAAEEAYVAAVEPFRERFAVLAKLVEPA